MQEQTLPSYSVRRRADRDNLWYAYFRVSGKQKQVCIPNSKAMRESQAREAARGPIKAVLALPEQPPTIPSPTTKTRWEASVEAWISLEKGLLKPGSLRDIRYGVRFYLERTGAEFVEDLTQEASDNAVREIQRMIREGERQPHYWANSRARSLEFLAYAKRRGLIAENFLEGTEAPKKGTFRKVEVKWEDEEFEKVYAAIELPWVKKALHLMRYSGMDFADLGTIEKQHVQKDKKGHWVLIKKRKKEERFEDAVIALPLNPKIKDIFLKAAKEAVETTSLLFPDLAHMASRANNNNLYHRIEVGWKRVYPNRKVKGAKALRHTFITWCIEELGIPLDVVQRWVGHSDTSTVLRERYLHRTSTAEFASLVA